MLDEDEEGGEFHHIVYALDGGMLFGLHTHMGREAKDRADERRTGLDHISFGLSGTAELEKWRDRLDELGIAARRDQEGALRHRASRSATPTTSPSSSSSRPAPESPRA